jgi:hypothetical protein
MVTFEVIQKAFGVLPSESRHLRFTLWETQIMVALIVSQSRADTSTVSPRGSISHRTRFYQNHIEVRMRFLGKKRRP